MRFTQICLIGLVLFLAGTASSQTVQYSMLPSERSAQTGDLVTVYASFINPTDSDWTLCRFEAGVLWPFLDGYNVSWTLLDDVFAPIPESYRQPFDIPAGGVSNFIIQAVPRILPNGSETFSRTFWRHELRCGEGNGYLVEPAPGSQGMVLNTFSERVPPDVIMVMQTLSQDGVVRFDENGTGIASIAAINIGASANLQFLTNAIADVDVLACRSDEHGICLHPRASNFDVSMAENEVAFFSIILQQRAGAYIPFRPDFVRLEARIEEALPTEYSRSASYVSLYDPSPSDDVINPIGIWRGTTANSASLNWFLALTEGGRYILGRHDGIDGRSGEIIPTLMGEYQVVRNGADLIIQILSSLPDGYPSTVPSINSIRINSDGVMEVDRPDQDLISLIQVDTSISRATPGSYFTEYSASLNATAETPAEPNLIIQEDGSITGTINGSRNPDDPPCRLSAGPGHIVIRISDCPYSTGFSYWFETITLSHGDGGSTTADAAMILIAPNAARFLALHNP